MADFELYVEGQEEPLDISDTRFHNAEELTRHLEQVANRPKWICLGGVSIFSQNITAIQESELT